MSVDYSKPITEFAGMNNVDKQNPIRLIHNMYPTTDLKLVKRAGQTKVASLIGSHSLYAFEGYLFYVAKGTTSVESLYKLRVGETPIEVTPIYGVGNPMYYVEIGPRLFMSSKNWNGVYEGGTVRGWGNPTSDDISAYMDDPDSARTILMGGTLAPRMELLTHVGGRILGAVENRVYYNDPPLAYDSFKEDSFIEFKTQVTMIAECSLGVYIGTDKEVTFCGGFDVNKWNFKVFSDGAIKGSLQYIPDYQGGGITPIWASKSAIYTGSGGGVQCISDSKVNLTLADTAASYYNPNNAGGQYIVNTKLPSNAASVGDTVVAEVIRNGKLI